MLSVNVGFEHYLIAAAIFGAALIILVHRTGRMLTPFHFCLLGFAAELVFAVFPLMQDEPKGGTKIFETLPETNIVIFGAAISLFLLTAKISGQRTLRLDQYRIEPVLPRFALILAFLGVVVLAGAITFLRLHSFPLFMLAGSTETSSVVYSDVFGRQTPFGWGASRALYIWLAMEIATSRLALNHFIREHWLLVGSVLAALLLNTLDGQRNLAIMGLAIIFFVCSMRRILTWVHALMGGAAIVLFFVAIVLFRTSGYKDTQELAVTTGIVPVDKTLFSIVSYLEPNIHNLNNAVMINEGIDYGVGWLGTFIPIDPDYFPDTMIHVMDDMKIFSHRGMTFRTFYADTYRNFGVFGCILAGGLVYYFAVSSFNKSFSDPRKLMVFLNLVPAILFMPCMNTLVGLVAVIPLSLFGLLKLRPVQT